MESSLPSFFDIVIQPSVLLRRKTYHAFPRTASKRSLPSCENEQIDPGTADDCYRGAVEWLLEATRSEKRFPLVRAENISYGFRRNLLGLKRPAVLLIALCVVANVFFCIRENFQVKRPYAILGGVSGALALVAVGLVWLIVIKMPFVEDAGRSYALSTLSSMRRVAKQNNVQSREIRRL